MIERLDADLRQKLQKVKLLVLDVDGVLTDGGLYYTESGEELKKFNVKDGMGIKLVMEAGINVAILTSSHSASVLHRAKKLGISHVFLGVEDKLPELQNLCSKLDISLDQVAYIGDDVNDLPILKVVGCPITVSDGVAENRECAAYVTERAGGFGAVLEVCDLLRNVNLEVQIRLF